MATALKAEWTPDGDDVAKLIPTRTANASGDTQGAFNETTSPTLAQVLDVVNDFVAEVAGFVGPIPKVAQLDDPDGQTLVDMARRVVALGAASQVELTFYPDHGLSAYAPSQELYARYQTALKSLKVAVETVNAGQPIGGEDSPAPVYSFPSMDDDPTPQSPLTTYAEAW